MQAARANIERSRGCGEHPGTAQSFCREIGNEWRQQRKDDLNRSVVNSAPSFGSQPPYKQTLGNLSHDHSEERPGRRAERKGVTGHGCDRESIDSERGRIIHQPLAFQNSDETAGNS